MINKINPYSTGLEAGGVPKQGASQDTGFSIALDKALEAAETSSGIHEFASDPLGEITSIECNPDCSSLIKNQTNELLNLLENYSDKLGNPSISMKELSFDLEMIQSQAEDLLKETEGDGTEADATLKAIARQSAITASTEYLKFHRGDYL